MQPASLNSPLAQSPPGQVLPEFWPDQAPPTVRPVWIPWPTAVLLAPLFWLMPKRFGPHFAAASWTAAVVAHIVWAIYGAAALCMTLVLGPAYTLASYLLGRVPEQQGQSLFPVPTLGEILRAPLALLAGMVAEVRLTGPGGTMQLTQIVSLVLLAELGLVLLAGLLMPFIAAGERTRRLLGRTLKLVLWASTSLVVLAVAIQVLLVRNPNALSDWPIGVMITLYGAWVIWLVIRGGSRYAGPAEGPAWERKSPLCAGCGYGLTALSCDSACPECGQMVAESLPESRRPSPFAAATSTIGRLVSFPRTCWRALWGSGFYDQLQTRDGFPAARRFAIWTSAVTSILLLGLLGGGFGLYSRIVGLPSGWNWRDLPAIFAASIWLALGLMGLIGLAALAVSRFGWRPMHQRSMAAFYWSVWLLPLAASAMAAAAAIAILLERPFFSYFVNVPQLGRMDLYVALVSMLAIVPVAMLWRALVHLGRAVKAVRYANS